MVYFSSVPFAILHTSLALFIKCRYEKNVISVKIPSYLTLRLLMSYIYGSPYIYDVSISGFTRSSIYIRH